MADNSPPPSVRYKTYQSKRASTSSLQSIVGKEIATPRVAAGSNHPNNAATASKDHVTAKPSSPSPLSRPANPSYSTLDRFPSPPLPSSKNFSSLQQAYLSGSTPATSTDGTDSTPNLSRSSSRSNHNTALPAQQQKGKGKMTAYLSGFQPKGVYRPRTEEFHLARNTFSENKRLERARIARRLEKLIALHFPNPSNPSSLRLSLPVSKSNTSLSEAIRSSSASDLWSSVKRSVQGSTISRMQDLRVAEQLIVKWQDDKVAVQCPICTITFSLTVRKHHCRLCGRVICFIPPNDNPPPLGRDQRCSTFITLENNQGFITEIEDAPSEEAQAFRERHGVRICQDCLATVKRHQNALHPPALPAWYKMHELLVELQKEIDAALPAFQEQILSSTATIANLPASQRSALLTSRKKILSLLASVDSLGKRIKDYPLGKGQKSGGAQDRLLKSIANRSTIFLQDRMSLLKALGSFDELPPSSEADVKKAQMVKKQTIQDLKASKELEERAEQLSVLLEQEKLVQGYLETASAKRQLVDSSALQQSLVDLRAEIARVKSLP